MSVDEERVLSALLERGLMPMTSREGESLVQLVTGAPIRGSWWGHERGGEIFELASRLDDRDDIWLFDLVGGRQTFVHRRLWPALVCVAGARDRTVGLGDTPLALLAAVRKETLRLDRWDGAAGKVRSAAAKALCRRLLVVSRQVHTESGRHARWLDTFERWADDETRRAASALDLVTALVILQKAAVEPLLPVLGATQ